jgi:hypothetical protein
MDTQLLRSKVVHCSADGFVQLEITERIALILKNLKRPAKADGAQLRIQCIYLGFVDQNLAENFASYIRRRFEPFSPRLIVRERERTGFENSHEIKLWGIPGREAELMQLVYYCASAAHRFPL